MNATRNETRPGVANEFGESAKRNATRWSETLLTTLDALASAALWGVFASTLVRCAFVPSERVVASTLVFLTFATPALYVLRETVWVWRDSPCRLPKSEFRARVRSASLPLWATAAVVAAAFGANGGDSACVKTCATALYVLCVDVGAARFARRWGATVARDWRLALENDATSSTKKVAVENVLTFETAAVCDVGEKKERAATNAVLNADPFEEEKEDFDETDGEIDGETLATQRRVRTANGGTQIFGSVAVEFEGDAEVAPIFIAFCPPFEGVPSFDFEQIAGSEIAVEPSSVQPFGVRLEAKRRNLQPMETQEVANDETIRVEYFAAFPPFGESSEEAF